MASLYIDGEWVEDRVFSVHTLGTDFLRGVTGEAEMHLSDGTMLLLEWEEATQNVVILGGENIERD